MEKKQYTIVISAPEYKRIVEEARRLKCTVEEYTQFILRDHFKRTDSLRAWVGSRKKHTIDVD